MKKKLLRSLVIAGERGTERKREKGRERSREEREREREKRVREKCKDQRTCVILMCSLCGDLWDISLEFSVAGCAWTC
jgi:hypothetical protein